MLFEVIPGTIDFAMIPKYQYSIAFICKNSTSIDLINNKNKNKNLCRLSFKRKKDNTLQE